MAQTYQGPKQLLPVAGKPLVEYTLSALPAEVDELVLIVGGPYEQQIREYFGGEHQGRKVTYAHQPEPLGLGHAIQQANTAVRGKFLVILPDDIYAAEDLRAMLEQPDLAALAKKVQNPENFGVLVCDDTGCLVRAVEKPKEFVSDLVSAGPYLLDREFFDVKVTPSARGEFELPDMVMALVRERNRRVKVLEASFWMAVNDPEQLSAAEEAILERLKVQKPA
ncbi:MAG: bifunctional UDP-N-acetylglucosamine pyrophosphorylase / Glucosamine-1-phosphate N-acetyltransferase [Parcubacteria group bacterium Gr01-1014_106]|nr:MAG: bifunctional UDP-N-acetylglucosamine pyrophosphorylase / Glucosamine-1-phosphate N-acetyltransferase [Parcubacteria group bacterium Gr01-1014_106]